MPVEGAAGDADGGDADGDADGGDADADADALERTIVPWTVIF